jgi:hypothetical protein
MKRTSYSTERSRAAVDARRIAGDARNTAWRALTVAEKVASLNTRLGAGVGATRQRRALGTVLATQQTGGV